MFWQAQILCICAGVTLAIEGSMAANCEDDKGYVSPRMFLGLRGGPGSLQGNRQLVAKALGGCQSPEYHFEQAVAYMESFGAKLNAMRRCPFEKYEDENVTVSLLTSNPESYLRMYMSVFYEYAEVKNDPYVFTFYTISAKTSFDGPRGNFPAGSRVTYGMLRWSEGSQRICVPYESISPRGPDSGGVLNSLVWNDIWGAGTMRGLIVDAGNGNIDTRFVINFPGSH